MERVRAYNISYTTGNYKIRNVKIKYVSERKTVYTARIWAKG
jgi:hypothetical protein